VADVFAVQEEIATRVARTLQGVVTREAQRALGAVARTGADAYDCYLRARQLCGRPSGARLEAARQLYRRATAIDPAYAPGWAGLADCDTFLFLYWGAPEADLARADEASRHAVTLGPEIAECHAARAAVLATLGRPAEADEAYRTAIRLRPRLPKTHYQYGRFCFTGGRLADATRAFETALALSPDEAHHGFLLAKVYERLGRAADARAVRVRGVDAAERQLANDPDEERVLYLGAGALVALGEVERGLEWAARALALGPDDVGTMVFAAGAYAAARRVDDALRLLGRALAGGFRHLPWIGTDPDFDRLRRHPRFTTLVA
jgi:adenylate cyclase